MEPEKEYRPGGPGFGPHQLVSIWTDRQLRNFDLMVILQVSAGENAAQKILNGEQLTNGDKETLVIANELAQQKGYLPIFALTETDARLAEDAKAQLEAFFSSRDWQSRDTNRTRKLR
ncbi:hypothetical protein [Psychromicrobium xiongbiense]|uniref:hypothetical protein n=1 Tax=Psychromicrobium xiongbiense TaxID=3051184 RepID=UPI002556670E|nr:hypothetical protein [Psychromicrobium sp. YIM S02556]